MEHWRSLRLLDSHGRPIAAHLEQVLASLRPRLLREFPVLKDEVALIDVMEEAARRISLHEERSGPIERLPGYAWVTLRSVATSAMRTGPMRLIRSSLGSQKSQEALGAIHAETGTADRIEQDILLKEALSILSEEERLVCIWKQAGFSSREIARHQRSTSGAIDLLFFRAKEKIRKALGVHRAHRDGRPATRATESNKTATIESPAAPESVGTEDGDSESGQ